MAEYRIQRKVVAMIADENNSNVIEKREFV